MHSSDSWQFEFRAVHSLQSTPDSFDLSRLLLLELATLFVVIVRNREGICIKADAFRSYRLSR